MDSVGNFSATYIQELWIAGYFYKGLKNNPQSWSLAECLLRVGIITVAHVVEELLFVHVAD